MYEPLSFSLFLSRYSTDCAFAVAMTRGRKKISATSGRVIRYQVSIKKKIALEFEIRPIINLLFFKSGGEKKFYFRPNTMRINQVQ